MVKQKIYIIDTLKSVVGGSAITGYTGVASGVEIGIDANSVSMVIGKSATADVNLGRTDSALLYEEGDVQHNSVANRSYTISGVLDIGDPAKKVANKLIYKYLIQAVRSPAIFALRCELTDYDDDAVGTYNDSALSTNITAGKYELVVFTNFSPTTSADDQNIIDFNLEAVLVND
jgi:hypothetical protein